MSDRYSNVAAYRQRLKKYFTKTKPDGWRNYLSIVNQGPSWRVLGLYYECVRVGGIQDPDFQNLWSIGGVMPRPSSDSVTSESGLAGFLFSIKQEKNSSADSDSSDSTKRSQGCHKVVSRPESVSQSDKPVKEMKKTVSMMIEPSLYEKVRRLAEIQERSIGAQIRHAIKLDLDRNAHLLDE